MPPEDEDDPFIVPGSMAAWSQSGGFAALRPDAEGDRYARGGELGRGGMAVVEAAVDRWLDREVAIKRPHASLSVDELARLTREARITARLVHPAIPPVYDVGEDDRGAWYSMPVLTGRTLRERLAEGRLTLRALVDALAAVSRAVGYAHDRGLVHRDLKPDNILLGDHGEVWVLDWGVAFDAGQPDTALVGTPGYLAPEQAHGAPPVPQADVFSLGVTLGSILRAEPTAHPELEAVVARCTAAEPGDRYADGTALALELEAWLDGQPVLAHDYSLGQVLWRAVKRWRAPLAVATLAGVVGGVLGVGALRTQAAERARADASLGVALSQQAAALRAQDVRPEAEVLAAHALALAESPVARGVLMAWSLVEPAPLVGIRPRSCARPFAQPDGHVVCVGSTVQVFDPQGGLAWSAPVEPLPPVSGGWVGEVGEVRRYPDGTLLLRHSSGELEVWREGRRQHVIEATGTFMGLAWGTVPAVFDFEHVGRLDLDAGTITMGPSTCEHIETVAAFEDRVIVGCRERRAFDGTWDAPGLPVELPGSPSAVTWAAGPVIGTFEGDLVTRGDDGWQVAHAGLGAVRQLVALDGQRLAVVGERGQARIWTTDHHAFAGTLPRVRGLLGHVDGDLLVLGDDVRRYALPQASPPMVFDASAQGGIASFDVSPSGQALVAGNADGTVLSWQASTGAVQRHPDSGGSATLGARFLDDDAFVYATLPIGLARCELSTGTSGPWREGFARRATAWRGGLASLPWSSHVLLHGGEERVLPLPHRPLALAAGQDLWVSDESGGIHALVGEGFVQRFVSPEPPLYLAVSGPLLLLAVGDDVEARTEAGAVVWRWAGATRVTALAASEAWIAVGDLDGVLHLLRPDGSPVAQVGAHERRISELVVRDDRVYSASWDGRVRVWGLGDLDTAAEVLVDRFTATWGLSLDAALAGAGSPRAGGG